MLKRGFTLLLAALPVAGCWQTKVEPSPDLTIHTRSTQCRIKQPVLRELINREEAVQAVTMRLLPQKAPPLPDIDFANRTVVLLAMGEQPSSGYRIEIDPAGVRSDQGRLWIPVHFRAPEKAIVATVMTSPCLIFSLRREGITQIVAGDTGLTLDLLPLSRE